MKDISSVQEVFTTKDCQVVLYAALWPDLAKVPLPGWPQDQRKLEKKQFNWKVRTGDERSSL